MIEPVPGQEIVNACRVLFPAGVAIDPGFLCSMADADIKAAFRKKALQTHPDRSQALGRSQEELSRLFQDVNSAYDVLKTFLSRRTSDNTGDNTGDDSGYGFGYGFGNSFTSRATGYQSGFQSQRQTGEGGNSHFNSRKRARPQPSSARTDRSAPEDYYYRGAMPRRELRLGEYLYYSRFISWRTLIAAIVWQKRQRPLFGEIARQWNFLSDEDIRLILKSKSWQEMFGEYARRHGFLSRLQQMAVTGRQRQLQPLFGSHFIHNGRFTASYIDLLVKRQQWYNARLR